MKNIPFKSKFNNDTDDGYSEMIDMSGDNDYQPDSFDPLKNKQDKYIGEDIDDIVPGGKVNRGGSITPGPNPSPTQYGRSAITDSGRVDYAKLDEIPFESEQVKAIGAELADENAIESLIDAQIDKLDVAMRTGDTPGVMKAEGMIKGYQGMLSDAMAVTKSKQDTFGVSYETEALKSRIQQASKGKLSEMDLELAAEDVRPSPKTPKGDSSPGIKGAYAQIDQQLLQEKKLPKAKTTKGEYSQSKSSMSKIDIGQELNQSRTVDKAAIDNTSATSGSLKETVAAGMGKVDPVTGKPYKLYTGVDSKGNIQPYKQPPVKSSQSPFPSGEAIPEAPNLPDARLEEQGYTPGITERRGQVPKGKFSGKKTSGNVVSSVTPDAPKQVVSQASPTESKSYLESYNKAIAEGATPRSAKRVADQLERLGKIRGRGKGKGKLLTTLGAVGIASIIDRNK